MTPQEFGELIRAHREAKGLGIEELASRFKLSVSTVRGIEEGSLDRMPHAVYAKGFVRAYAQAVGVSPEDLQNGLSTLFPEEMFADVPTVPGPVSGKAPSPGNRGRAASIFLSLLVLVLVGAAGWYAFSHFDALKGLVTHSFSAASPESDSPRPGSGNASATTQSGAVSPSAGSVSAHPASAASGPAVAARTVPAPEPQSPMSPPTSPRTQEQPRDTLAQQPVAVQDSPRDAQPVPPAASPATEAPLAGGKQIALDATEECWVQASVDGSPSRTFTVYPGETSILPYKTKLVLVLGNAGGVVITHNGKPYAHNSKRNEKKTLTFQ
ncbi:conserved hypothetical protein [uncultured delta proteobacterium]|uniref:HTH cro/C1-type domain-containing protein n=1 Tax=uncultured delta proteobacterium TaxID=34034 RepID=A0A212J1Y1_9DELT|nr:conserved hypothetical protein [uncultured delta proteobacterium]